MMNTPLTLVSLIERAEKYFPKKEVVSRTSSGVHRFPYKEIGKRTRSLSSALESLGVKKGDRVGTFAWNHHRHLEAYFAVPAMGAVLHMLNIRLSAEHLSYIINHAEDKVLLIDSDLLPLVEKIKDQLSTVEAFIVMTDEEALPESSLEALYSYEKLLEKADESYEFSHDIKEDDPAGMCYTSGTTGKPKGVVYSHRGLVLHSMALSLADTAAVSESDVCMPVVPMFHANAWGVPYAATWTGATQVLPGPMPTPKILAELIESEKVTTTAGVPTIWLGLLKELEQNSYNLDSLRAVLCGGSAAPKGMIRTFEEKYGIPFIHAYGMTETTPLVIISRLKSYQMELPYEDKLEIRSKQGIVVQGIDIKVINENGEVKPDGKEMGELLVRGPWIADSYYNDDRSSEAFHDGWLHTGDVVTIDEEGFVKIVDRTKDLIKSGGEWISSVDLENALMAHESVFEAAVISVPDPKWQERPVACVVMKDAYKDTVSKEDLLDFLAPQFAKWWLPDDVLFMDDIPKTSVGKFLKSALREKVREQYTPQ
ncbi:long-chain fatty acid--CoA ligase [Aquibacillus sp. 3ASR75-11]|uniref:Long-chain fatty acid--CoA ligase n=1 Tax=Terrihalobacillus insolitus TaxID=2950438 RepID=A0A9X3WNV1_9BACI|nr:long-chain fatty acid--CoA ligase [Terrihalobacillus insolitus]MDC3411874.1 long-chain fatty acid--CoA ligase [Terrihalobacillus insolitus]MDC3423447.1 long-chain fatty acid--CoA ligase [Terrihalobacillus insolitus]